jgi:Neuraminidase (sialidase)
MIDTSIQWSTSTGLSGKLSPIDSAASALHSANRLAFAKPAGIIIEYSNDAGATWVEYPTNDTNKMKLVSGIGQNYNIGMKSGNVTLNDQLRITLDATAM